MTPLRLFVKVAPSGLLMAHSPDMPGLHVMERTRPALEASLRELIPVLWRERESGRRYIAAALEMPNFQPGPLQIAVGDIVAARGGGWSLVTLEEEARQAPALSVPAG